MRRKARNHPFSDQWLEETLKVIQDSVETQGIKPALSQILQTLINAIMEMAMLASGYSKAQNSQESVDDVVEFIKDRLDFFKRQPLKSDWFAVFIDAYWGKLKDPETKNLIDVSIFVALGIDLDGYKHILGYWVLKGRESKAFYPACQSAG